MALVAAKYMRQAVPDCQPATSCQPFLSFLDEYSPLKVSSVACHRFSRQFAIIILLSDELVLSLLQEHCGSVFCYAHALHGHKQAFLHFPAALAIETRVYVDCTTDRFTCNTCTVSTNACVRYTTAQTHVANSHSRRHLTLEKAYDAIGIQW